MSLKLKELWTLFTGEFQTFQQIKETRELKISVFEKKYKILEVNRWRNRKSLLRTLIRERNGSEKSWFLQDNACQGNSSKLQSLTAGVCRAFTGMQS